MPTMEGGQGQARHVLVAVHLRNGCWAVWHGLIVVPPLYLAFDRIRSRFIVFGISEIFQQCAVVKDVIYHAVDTSIGNFIVARVSRGAVG